MKTVYILTALLSVALLSISPASADKLLETYEAKLSERDHFNSYGERLGNVAAIIRQDRANYHRFKKIDRGDQWDSFFASKQNRDSLEYMLRNGYISPTARQQILNTTPTIQVQIFQESIKVYIID